MKYKVALKAKYIFIVCMLFLSGSVFCKSLQVDDKKENNQQAVMLKNEDKLLEDVYNSVHVLYQKLVELTALSYCGNSKILQDRIMMELGKDVVILVKSLALYVPALLKNQKISKKTKFKKCLYVGGVVAVLSLWIKEYYKGSYGSPADLGRQRAFGSQNMYGYDYQYPNQYSNYMNRQSMPLRSQQGVDN